MDRLAARIPADVERPDRLAWGLTARQLAVLAVAGVLAWAEVSLLRRLLPLPVAVGATIPLAGTALAVVLARRDGLSLDRFLAAAWRFRRSPRRLVTAPEGIPAPPTWVAAPAGLAAPAPLRLPVHAIQATDRTGEVAVLDLGPDGLAVVIECFPVNFALHTPSEQEALVAGFARLLHAHAGPLQVLRRAQRFSLHAQVAELRDAAGGLPHPALERACRDYAAFLDHLGDTRVLLRQQILLALREPTAGQAPLLRRAEQTLQALTAIGVTAVPLDPPGAAALLAGHDGPAADAAADPAAGPVADPGPYAWEQAGLDPGRQP
jgi:hypothetical protein